MSLIDESTVPYSSVTALAAVWKTRARVIQRSFRGSFESLWGSVGGG